MRLPLLVSAVIAIAFAQNPRYEAIEIENVEVIYVEPEEASTCDTSVFNKCAIEHVKELGVRPGTGPSFYARRIMALEAVYGREGFRKICKADQTFRKCVGRTFDQCMTVDGLIAVGLPRSQALAYVEMFRKKDYECTNMQSITAKGTWECLGLTALDDGVEAMGVCMTVFVRHLTEKPRDACKFAQQYDLCIRRIFESRCGAKVGRGICEIVKIGLNLRLPQCQITCSKEESKHFPNRPHAVGHEFVTERRLINALESSEETDDDEECNANRLKQCATEAKNSLGITTSQIEQVIEKAGELAKTKEGYLRVCQAKKQFTQCAGSTVLPQCLKMESLMELGLSIINAAEVNISYFIMDFECKDEVFADNYECVMRAQKERYEELMTCQQHFQEMVSQQPSQDILCKALQDLANCNQQAYADECGAQVGEEICEFSGLMVKNFMPETQSCSVQ
uniref:Uncharacterized protein n=1 Tax=Plectus sambesii TaxID=2011161 RepID=A0A914ULH8_9BILA